MFVVFVVQHGVWARCGVRALLIQIVNGWVVLFMFVVSGALLVQIVKWVGRGVHSIRSVIWCLGTSVVDNGGFDSSCQVCVAWCSWCS